MRGSACQIPGGGKPPVPLPRSRHAGSRADGSRQPVPTDTGVIWVSPAAPQTLPFPRGGILWRLVNYSNLQIAVVELTSLERVKIFSLIEHLLPLIQSLFKGSFCCCCCYVPGFRYRHVLAVPRRPSPALPTAPSCKTREEEHPAASSMAFLPRLVSPPLCWGTSPLLDITPIRCIPKGPRKPQIEPEGERRVIPSLNPSTMGTPLGFPGPKPPHTHLVPPKGWGGQAEGTLPSAPARSGLGVRQNTSPNSFQRTYSVIS